MITKTIKVLFCLYQNSDDIFFFFHFFQVQKELLDAELELFTGQQDGSETLDIQKRVNHLRVEAARMGVLPTSRLVKAWDIR